MYDISNIASIVDGRSTVAPSENVRSVEKKSAGQEKRSDEQPVKAEPKQEEVKKSCV